MNAVLDKMTTSEELTQAQLEAVKTRAIALWGDNWKMQIAYKYAEVIGAENKREKTTLVRRWFAGESSPTLESFNNLLLAVGCKIEITCTEVKKIL